MKFQLAIFNSKQQHGLFILDHQHAIILPQIFTLEALQKTDFNSTVQSMILVADHANPNASHRAVLIDAETKAILCNLNQFGGDQENITMPIVLKDQASNNGQELFAMVHGNEHGITIQLAGYGNADSMPGNGAVLWLEFVDGQARVHVYDDINTGDPTSITLDGAKESARQADA